jgi:hypothetical protein
MDNVIITDDRMEQDLEDATTGHNNSEDHDENHDDDDVTIIFLDQENHPNQSGGPMSISMNHNNNNTSAAGGESGVVTDWMERVDGAIIYDARRRSILIRELKRVQRSSFIQFAILCALPVLLFFVMAILVFGQEETCVSTVTYCELASRTFVNAFTTRCVCDPIPVERNTTTGE